MTKIDRFRQCYEEAKRELGMRKKVYPNQIRNGRLTKTLADKQIAIMEMIMNDYKAALKREEEKAAPQLGLKL